MPLAYPTDATGNVRAVPVQIDRLRVAGTDAGPYGITLGPDGRVWVALEVGEIARLAVI